MITQCITCAPNSTRSEKDYFKTLISKSYIIYRETDKDNWKSVQTKYFNKIKKQIKRKQGGEYFHSSEFKTT